MKYSHEWEKTVTRLGRWIDFKNDYKTMDINFMESVWNVFKRLFDNNYVYRGVKVMPYSTGCTTPLSNFEANSNYKDVNDPEVFVTFPLVDEPDVSMIAWTTTPWTLPSNLALCVNPGLTYAKFEEISTKKVFIMMEARIDSFFPSKAKGKGKKDEKVELPYKILETFPGSALAGKKYVPLFNYFYEEFKETAFRIITGDYVKDNAGTGVVHQAPAFGVDDYAVTLEHGVIRRDSTIPCPLDPNGRFVEPVTDFIGQFVKDADKEIIKYLKAKGRIYRSGTIIHSYPFCWRSDTPLIYKAVPSWFVRVEDSRHKLLKNLETTYWVPEYVKDKRFHNWLKDACDWSISRSRYWGTPIPIWTNETFDEFVVIGSIAELEKLSGEKITDLHREHIDHIVIPAPSGKGNLKRIEEVFDCWFESGSMPYAQNHYPFSISDEEFHKKFPADFIAEGIDQTRGWFYTLLVLSTLLFDKAPFKNLIVNGLVLAADGKKMSKRLKNYPDPAKIIDAYGSDSLRMYLINSPVVRGMDLCFKEPGVFGVVKEVLLPWFNAYRFLVQNVLLHEKKQKEVNPNYQFTPDVKKALSSTNVMDRWILAATQTLVKDVAQEMKEYHLFTVLPKLLTFIEQLTNWYVRFNRKRLRGSVSEEETVTSLNCLFEVVLTLTKTMSPFTPFFTEYLYQNLRKCLPNDGDKEPEVSIHYCSFPTPRAEAVDPQIEKAVQTMQSVILLGRTARERRKIPLKTPIKEVTIILKNSEEIDGVQPLLSYIREELNVRIITFTSDSDSFIVYVAKANNETLGRRFRDKAKPIKTAIEKLSHAELKVFIETQKLTILDQELGAEDIQVVRTFTGDSKTHEAEWDDRAMIVLDIQPDKALLEESTCRNVISRVQRLRKESGVNINDHIEVFYESTDASLLETISNNIKYIKDLIEVPFINVQHKPRYSRVVGSREDVIQNGVDQQATLKLYITPVQFAIVSKIEGLATKEEHEDLQSYISALVYSKFANLLEKNGNKFNVVFNSKQISLTLNENLFPTVDGAVNH